MPRRPSRSPRRTARETAAAYTLPLVMVDSNVLIDVLENDPAWYPWSSEQLEPLIASQRAVINSIIYVEIAANFATIEALEHAISEYGLVREELPWEAAFMASQAYKLYRKRGGAKRSPLPDFYIGAHAALAGYPLVTRDPDRYRRYFARLKLIAPD
jgi:predicted nucleic acid-binding protein